MKGAVTIPVDFATLKDLVIFVSIAQGLETGKSGKELLGEVSKTVSYAYKENDVELVSTSLINAIVTEADVKHFHDTFITYEGHYA